MQNYFHEARHAWLAAGKPMLAFTPIQDRPKEETQNHASVWASSLWGCRLAHARKRLGLAPALPLLAEFSDDTRTKFYYGTAVEHLWVSALHYYFNRAGATVFTAGDRVEGHGVSGWLDGLARLDQGLVPIEVKYSENHRVQLKQFSQLAAYCYALDANEGWLVVSHPDGTFTSAVIRLEDGCYRLYNMDDDLPYRNGRAFFVSREDFAEAVDAHQRAYTAFDLAEEAAAHRLPVPFYGQCFASAGKGLVKPSCPYFCWSAHPQESYPVANGQILIDEIPRLLQGQPGKE